MGTLSLANGTYNSSDLAPATSAGNDSLTVSSATLDAIYSPTGGDDLYSVTDSSVGLTNNFAFQGGAGDDTLTATGSTVNGALNLGNGNNSLYLENVGSVGVISASTGNDTLNLNSVTISQGQRSIGLAAGNDSISLDSVTGITTLDPGGGSNSVTLTDTTIGSLRFNIADAVDSQSISLDGSSINASLNTFQSSLNHVVLNDSTINGAMSFNNFSGGSSEPRVSTIEILNGSSLAGGISYGNSATLSDSIHVADSTVSGAIFNGNQGINSLGADTIMIENSALTGVGNIINLSGDGDQVTVTNTSMENGNINISSFGQRGLDYTISVSNTTLNDIVNQGSGNISVDVVNSSMGNFSFEQSQAADSLTINVDNSTLTDRNDLGNGSETMSLIHDSEFTGDRIYLNGGNDKLVLGTDTKFATVNSNYQNHLGLNGWDGNDTLELRGGGAFSILLEDTEAATLQNGDTVTLITNENLDQVSMWASVNGEENIRGSLSLRDSDSTVLIQRFEEINAVPCFVKGTMILTDNGERPVESLRVGDLVLTVDAGLQPVRWVKSSHINALNMLFKPEMTPIRIKKGAQGHGLPTRDLLVSPQHRMLVSGKIVERMFGAAQVLVAAKHLLEIEGIERATDQTGFDYVHFMLDDHRVVYAEGSPTESLFIGEMAIEIFGEDASQELEEIFPELHMPVSDHVMKPAGIFLTGKQGRKLAERIAKNGHSLIRNSDGIGMLLSY